MHSLTDEVLDEISVGLFGGVPAPLEDFATAALIPFAEWHWLRASGHQLPALHAGGRLSAFVAAARQGLAIWADSISPRCGFVRVMRQQTDTEHAAWLQFLSGFTRAAENSGLAHGIAVQFAGVVGEMEDNVHTHSQNVRSGRVAYLAGDGAFEFVVLDRGVGVLASLRQSDEFSHLRDHGEALETATTTGASRFGSDSGRGWGFSDLITGIANSNAHARFRSGDHLLRLDGIGAGQPASALAQRALGIGFLISIRVQA
jgi:hypothetical protein